MKQYHKNPRQITEKQMSQLTDNLSELGDLSGIVHDLNSDEIIGGNQRSRAFNIDLCEIELTHQADEPDEQGTVAHGFIVWKGKRYAYRQVRWTPKQCERANVTANKLGGSWDFDILANEFDVSDLLDWGFMGWEIGIPDEVDIDAEWQGMPEFHNEPNASRTIYIHFANEDDVIDFCKLIEQSITDKTKSIWYPRKADNIHMDKRLAYSAES